MGVDSGAEQIQGPWMESAAESQHLFSQSGSRHKCTDTQNKSMTKEEMERLQ